MQVQPIDHYELVETIVSKTSDLASYFERVQQVAEDRQCDVYWRGQANHTWSVASSLVRRMSNDSLTDGDLKQVEQRIVSAAKDWIVGTSPGLRSNLEWLAYLQHNWVPTRLLDFTPDPFVATFFASESLDEVDGRIFSVLVPRAQPTLDGSADFDINDTASGAVRVFRPRAQVSPRLAAQSGVFLLGKLPSTHVSRWVKDNLVESGQRQMLKHEVSMVMSLPFYFRTEGQQARPSSRAVAAYSARVHINKASVRRELAGKGSGNRNLKPPQPVNHAFCYPDVDGMRRYSPLWSTVFPGTSALS